jgi:hypothetical protein
MCSDVVSWLGRLAQRAKAQTATAIKPSQISDEMIINQPTLI